MKPDLLSNATLKIDRAKHHIDDLRKQVTDFFAAHWRILLVDKPEAGKRALFLKADKPVPVDAFGLLIGDAVHCLHCALDHCVWAHVAPKKPRRESQVQFPFAPNAKTFQRSIRDRQIEVAGPEIVKIVTDAMPYHGGDEDLASLHDLDILDKHRVITPTWSVLVFKDFNLQKIDPSAPRYAPGYARLGFVGMENEEL